MESENSSQSLGLVGRTDQPEYIGKNAGHHALPRWVLCVESVVAEAIGDGAGDGDHDGNEMQGRDASDEDGPKPDDG